MIPAQRRARILEELRREGTVSIQDLSDTLETSSSTIRRDLDYLAEKRYLERTFGGAQLANSSVATTFEPEYEIGQHTHEVQKRAIGRLAATMVPAGASVFLDSSSTVWQAADFLASGNGDLTAVSNDLNIATRLVTNSRITTIVTGGTARPHSYTLLGQPGTSFLRELWVDIAFIGAHSLHEGVLSDSSVEVVELKRTILKASKQRIVLADSSKFTASRSFSKVADLSEVDVLVTDEGITDRDRDLVERAGVELHIARLEGT